MRELRAALGMKVPGDSAPTVVCSANASILNLLGRHNISLWYQEKAKQDLSPVCVKKQLSEASVSCWHYIVTM